MGNSRYHTTDVVGSPAATKLSTVGLDQAGDEDMSQIEGPEDRPHTNMRMLPRRRLTVSDGMILTAAVAIGLGGWLTQ
jgi:hypothetical protein